MRLAVCILHYGQSDLTAKLRAAERKPAVGDSAWMTAAFSV